ncbi:MAG: cyclic nucleotide-binding domain-containing protein [Bdellovibrionales bacterium]
MSIGQNGDQSFVMAHGVHRQFNITPLQKQYLERLKLGQSVEQLVLDFLSQGLLVRFGELHDLMQLLFEHKLITNDIWQELLSNHSNSAPRDELKLSAQKVTAHDLSQFPFFHSLDPRLLELFAANSEIYDCPANTRLCTQGQTTRDLFALCKGTAAVYRNETSETRRLLTKLAVPAVFGEGGFLLGRPRSADVVTTSASQVIRIRHKADIDNMIRGNEASQMYRRFWVLHAFANSTLFQKLPLEAWDDLALLGEFHKLSRDQLIFNEGSPGTSFFIVVQGQVSAWQKGHKINTLEQGSCFGEIALFASRGIRTASVKTDLDSLLVEISPKQFYPLLARQLLLAKELEQLAYQRLQADITRPAANR